MLKGTRLKKAEFIDRKKYYEGRKATLIEITSHY